MILLIKKCNNTKLITNNESWSKHTERYHYGTAYNLHEIEIPNHNFIGPNRTLICIDASY